MGKQGKAKLILIISAGIGAVGFIAVGMGFLKTGGILIAIGSLGIAVSQ